MKICFKLGIADIFYLAVAFHNEIHVSLGPGPVDRVSHQEDEFDPRHDLMNEFDAIFRNNAIPRRDVTFDMRIS